MLELLAAVVRAPHVATENPLRDGADFLDEPVDLSGSTLALGKGDVALAQATLQAHRAIAVMPRLRNPHQDAPIGLVRPFVDDAWMDLSAVGIAVGGQRSAHSGIGLVRRLHAAVKFPDDRPCDLLRSIRHISFLALLVEG